MQGFVMIMQIAERPIGYVPPLSGPSHAISYAVGIVPQSLQLQSKKLGSHIWFAGSHLRPAGSHLSITRRFLWLRLLTCAMELLRKEKSAYELLPGAS